MLSSCMHLFMLCNTELTANNKVTLYDCTLLSSSSRLVAKHYTNTILVLYLSTSFAEILVLVHFSLTFKYFSDFSSSSCTCQKFSKYMYFT